MMPSPLESSWDRRNLLVECASRAPPMRRTQSAKPAQHLGQFQLPVELARAPFLRAVASGLPTRAQRANYLETAEHALIATFPRAPRALSKGDLGRSVANTDLAIMSWEHPTLEATQGQILSQSPTDATSSRWHLYGS